MADPATMSPEQLADLKKSLDEAVEKKLNMYESKIKEQSDKIAGLLAVQDDIRRQLAEAERKLLVRMGDDHRRGSDDVVLIRGNPNIRSDAPTLYAPIYMERSKALAFGHLALAMKHCDSSGHLSPAGMKHVEKMRELFPEFAEKAQTVSDDTTGGVFVTTDLYREVIRLVSMYGVGRANVRVVPLTTGGENVWPKRTGGLTVYAPGEGGTITPSNVTWGNVKLVAKKWATLTAITSELNEDAIVDIGAIVAEEIAHAFAMKEDDCIFNGTGAAATYFGITGLLNAAAAGAIKSTASDDWADITIANILQCPASIADYADRAGNLKWYLHRTPYFAGFVDAMLGQGGSTAEEVRSNAFTGGVRTILGYPVELTNVLPGTDGVASTAFGVFGDLRMVSYLGDRRALNIARSNEVYFASDQIGIRATQRLDYVVHDVGTATAAGGYIVLKTGASD